MFNIFKTTEQKLKEQEARIDRIENKLLDIYDAYTDQVPDLVDKSIGYVLKFRLDRIIEDGDINKLKKIDEALEKLTNISQLDARFYFSHLQNLIDVGYWDLGHYDRYICLGRLLSVNPAAANKIQDLHVDLENYYITVFLSKTEKIDQMRKKIKKAIREEHMSIVKETLEELLEEKEMNK